MTTVQKVDPAFAPHMIPSEPEIVHFSATSLFKSRCFKMLGTAVVLAASVIWILPAAASLNETTLDPLVIKSLLGTLLVGVALLGLKMKKEVLYEISILYTIWGAKPWWTEIDENLVLGALPLEHQMETLKALGVTHVISVIEPFEFMPGIVQPAQSEQWGKIEIQHKHIEAPDFFGVAKEKIHEGIEYMHAELQKNPKAKFYIHCKAGRGRSATLLLCYMKTRSNRYHFSSKKTAYTYLKTLRPQVNLNKNQMFAAQNYLDSGFFAT